MNQCEQTLTADSLTTLAGQSAVRDELLADDFLLIDVFSGTAAFEELSEQL